MKKIIIANWKMNPVSKKEAETLFEKISKGIEGIDAEVVICPPFIYLPLLKGMALGAQDVYLQANGAFTGEVSPLMLKDLGVKYAIIGHSERRALGETDELISKKLKSALEVGLMPILCIGEKEGENREEVLRTQIAKSLTEILPSRQSLSAGGNHKSKILNLIIAYEPVWAIGTGKNCSVEDTRSAVEFIKKLVGEIRIIYGGSVNSKNAELYLKEENIDGLLVGGASLDAKEFIKIIQSANN